jgi:hypothetical protein
LWQTDRLVFAFLLCCHLLVGEGKLEQKTLEQLVVFLRCLKCKSKEDEEVVEDDKDGSLAEGEVKGEEKGEVKSEEKGEEKQENTEQKEKKSPPIVLKPKPSHLSWLKERSWNYFVQFEEEFEELRGIHNARFYFTR